MSKKNRPKGQENSPSHKQARKITHTQTLAENHAHTPKQQNDRVESTEKNTPTVLPNVGTNEASKSDASDSLNRQQNHLSAETKTKQKKTASEDEALALKEWEKKIDTTGRLIYVHKTTKKTVYSLRAVKKFIKFQKRGSKTSNRKVVPKKQKSSIGADNTVGAKTSTSPKPDSSSATSDKISKPTNSYDLKALLKAIPTKMAKSIKKMARKEKEAIASGDDWLACAAATNIGSAYRKLKDDENLVSLGSNTMALKAWTRATKVNDCSYGAYNLATYYRDFGETQKASKYYLLHHQRSRSLDAKYPTAKVEDSFKLSSKVALKFHADQMQHLIDEGEIGSSYQKEVDACREILNRVPYNVYIKLRETDSERIPSYNRAYFIDHKERIPGGVLNARADISIVEKTYSEESIVVVDNFLKPEALARLHEFASRSTIYYDSKPRGYMGTYWEDGFNTPLLDQVVEELAAMFPNIFHDFPLTNSWAYNYDDNYQQGIKIHGDQAAVNCNLWITDDDANLDKDSGGLIIYTTPVPLDWDFAIYNTEEGDDAVAELLKNSGKVVVPFRQNRIVLFKSDLLHATDNIKFKSGWKNRRINLTFLYGDRGHGDDAFSIQQRKQKSIADHQKNKRRSKKL